MRTVFEYSETIEFKGGKIKAVIEMEYNESGKALSEEEYSKIVGAAKDAKKVINAIAKEHKK